jgi:hypothetical protein
VGWKTVRRARKSGDPFGSPAKRVGRNAGERFRSPAKRNARKSTAQNYAVAKGARKSGARNLAPTERVGRDGKSYPAKRKEKPAETVRRARTSTASNLAVAKRVGLDAAFAYSPIDEYLHQRERQRGHEHNAAEEQRGLQCAHRPHVAIHSTPAGWRFGD